MDDLIALKMRELELEQARLARLKDEQLWTFEPYGWQREFWDAGRYNKQRMLMAANQVGKTSVSCVEAGYHLTGKYPPDWNGYRFNHPINAWALGVSGEQIKSVLQSKIIGRIISKDNDCEGGLIPSSLLLKGSLVKGALKDSIKEASIEYASGGYSTLSFKSYEQGQAVLMGEIIDLVLIDEEPRDPTIYPQVLTRTLNGDQKRGGLVILSFTPEWGTTELVYQFTEKLQLGQYFKNVTWNDAPHLTEERKEQILASLPDHQREMRSKGIPILGSGRIYPCQDEQIIDNCDRIPDHWPRIGGIDFGWNFTALIWMAIDRDSGVFHIYDALKIEKEEPMNIAMIMRKRGDWIPWSWPMDGHLPEKRQGTAQKDLYAEEGVNMLPSHATDKSGSVSVEAGLSRIRQLMKVGQWKVAEHLKPYFEEYRLYHRKEHKIVKSNDHLLDASRYAEMMNRHAITKEEAEGAIIEPTYLRSRYKR